LTEHSGKVYSLQRIQDLLISGSSDKTIKVNQKFPNELHSIFTQLWDVSSSVECKSTLTGHSAGINSIALVEHGPQIASGGDDKAIRVHMALLVFNP
jgi:WD40 repeat protein